MRMVRLFWAYVVAALVAFAAAAIFYSQQILAKQAEIGAVYTPAQQIEAYFANAVGLAPAYGAVLAIALLVGFVVAAILKRVLRPVAPIAYPLAGAAAVGTSIVVIENTMAAGGAGAIGGARDALGFGLQCLAGALGGLAFEILRPKR
jgi:hypothetical protein